MEEKNRQFFETCKLKNQRRPEKNFMFIKYYFIVTFDYELKD